MLVRFNPTDETFEVFTLPSSEANSTGTIIDLVANIAWRFTLKTYM